MERGRGGEREEEEEDRRMERLGRKVYSSSDTLKAFEDHHVVDINSGEMLNKHTAGPSRTYTLSTDMHQEQRNATL